LQNAFDTTWSFKEQVTVIRPAPRRETREVPACGEERSPADEPACLYHEIRDQRCSSWLEVMHVSLRKPPLSIGCEAIVLVVAVFGLILGPYLTVWLPFRRSLEVRAVLVLVFTSIPLVIGLRQKGWLRRILEAPRAVFVGVVLWAAAAVLGTIVGLIRGNEPYLIAGQLFSMALLPFAFVAARSLDLTNRARVFAAAFIGAAFSACVLHFGYWAVRTLVGRPLLRLYLPKGLSVVGVSIMALIVALALATRKGGRSRTLGLVCTPVFGVYILGSGTRSVVVAAALGVLVFLLVWGTARSGIRGLVAAVIIVAVIGLTFFSTLAAAWNAPRDSVFPMESFLEPYWVPPSGGEMVVVETPRTVAMEMVWRPDGQARRDWISSPYPLDPEGVHRVSVEMMGEGVGAGSIDFVFLTPSLDECSKRTFRVAPGGGWRLFESALPRELAGSASVVRIRVGNDRGAHGTWRVRNVRLEEYSEIVPRPVQRGLVFLRHRILSSWDMIREGRLSQDPSMRVRLKESAAALHQVRRARLPWKIFGHGLGARLEFEESGYNTLGEETVIKNPNYIHNFFAFLALKLGLLGGLSIFAAFFAWIYRSVQMISHRTRIGSVAPGAASLAVWFAYISWSVFCPQLIDFGDAPLFGFFLACWMAADNGSPPASASD
jgi:hypothetical protein